MHPFWICNISWHQTWAPHIQLHPWKDIHTIILAFSMESERVTALSMSLLFVRFSGALFVLAITASLFLSISPTPPKKTIFSNCHCLIIWSQRSSSEWVKEQRTSSRLPQIFVCTFIICECAGLISSAPLGHILPPPFATGSISPLAILIYFLVTLSLFNHWAAVTPCNGRGRFLISCLAISQNPFKPILPLILHIFKLIYFA